MTRWTCLLCGRATVPAVTIGDRVVGPRCAKRMGLTKATAPKTPRIKWRARQAPVRADAAQADLFEAMA
jgi:hypothetical protein